VFITMNLAVIASPKVSSPTVLGLAELFGQGRRLGINTANTELTASASG
jgi:hypothetical protein